jgi:hypothetical protein
MFSVKRRDAAPAHNPLEGRLLEGRGVEAANLIDRCQEALNRGSYTLLADASPRGAVARLDLQDESYVAAVALDQGSQKAAIYLLHRSEGRDHEVAKQMATAVFGGP